MTDEDLRAFVSARLDEAETDARRRGLSLWHRPWERSAVATGSTTTLRLIATSWADHPDFRPEWRPAR